MRMNLNRALVVASCMLLVMQTNAYGYWQNGVWVVPDQATTVIAPTDNTTAVVAPTGGNTAVVAHPQNNAVVAPGGNNAVVGGAAAGVHANDANHANGYQNRNQNFNHNQLNHNARQHNAGAHGQHSVGGAGGRGRR